MRTILILILIASIQIGLNGQERKHHFSTKYIYEMTYQLDSLDSLDIRTDRMELLYNDSITIFQSVGKGFRDSVNYFHRKDDPAYDLRYDVNFQDIGRLTTHYCIYRRGDHIRVVDSYSYGGIQSDGYQYYDERLAMDWQLTGKVDTITGFHVENAVLEFGGRQWEAWFAPEIPTDAGPYKFYGLPGLIVMVRDKRAYWCFSLRAIINTNRTVEHEDILSEQIAKTTKEKFFKDRLHYYTNKTVLDEAAGDVIFPTPEGKRRAIARDRLNVAKMNNWIELYP